MPLICRRSAPEPRRKKHRRGLHTSSHLDSLGVDDECDKAKPKQQAMVAGEHHTIGNRTSQRRPLLGFGLSKKIREGERNFEERESRSKHTRGRSYLAPSLAH